MTEIIESMIPSLTLLPRREQSPLNMLWIGTGTPKSIGDADSDVMLIKQGYITVTPLHRDLTAYSTLEDTELKTLFHKVNHEIIQKTV